MPANRCCACCTLEVDSEKSSEEKDRVVVISTAHGLKFSQFKVDYHEKTLAGVESRFPNPPVFLPAEVSAVKRALDQVLK